VAGRWLDWFGCGRGAVEAGLQDGVDRGIGDGVDGQGALAGGFETASTLVARDAAPAVRLRTAEAELEAARAEVESIEVDIENTSLRAPIPGVVNRLISEVGDFVQVGGEVVEIVDNDPLVAVVHVPQHAVGRVRAGGEAHISIIGREAVAGTIRSVAPLADAQTRTFRVEIEVPNSDLALPSGISAEVVIPTETVLAHRVSPAIVSLNDRGEMGVFAVEDDGTVAFHPILFVRAEADGVWITGPPEEVRLIMARPGFVTPGQRVVADDVEAPVDGGAGGG
jgi:membrane fusion protein, multidrug efflux system